MPDETPAQEPKAKKSRTNTPWTAAEEQRLKTMRDAGNSWSEIAKVDAPAWLVRAEMHRLLQQAGPRRRRLTDDTRPSHSEQKAA